MGVKGLLQILEPYLKYTLEEKNVIGMVHVDFSGIIYMLSYSLVEGDDEDPQKEIQVIQSENRLVGNGYYIKLQNLQRKIYGLISNLPYRSYHIVFCLDGDKRPTMKKKELERRGKYASRKSLFIKNMIHKYSDLILQGMSTKKSSKILSIKIQKASYEADALVAKGTMAITTDSDIFLLGLYRKKLDCVVFYRQKGRLMYLEMTPFRNSKMYRYLYFACFAGNDYLPKLYSPKYSSMLFENMSENLCECYKNIYLKLRPRPIIYKTVTEVEPHVRVWLANIKAYLQYLASGESLYLDSFNDDFNIKQCLPKAVYECLLKMNT